MDEKVKSPALDYRAVFVVVLRKIVGYSIFFMLIYCFFIFREDINMLNFYRIVSYFDTDAESIQNFTSYEFESGIENTSATFAGGLVVLNRDSLKIINAAGIEDLSVQLKYENPRLVTGDRRVLAYDMGGNKFSIFGSYALLKQYETASPIINCDMNNNGDIIVIYDESGYKGSVQVFSSDLKEKFQWSTSEYYILSGCINENGNNFSIICMDSSTGEPLLRTYSVKNSVPIYEVSLGERIVYSLKYNSDGTLWLICSDGVYTYDSKGKETAVYSYETGDLKCFEHRFGTPPVAAISQSGGSKIVSFDSDGSETYREGPSDIKYVCSGQGMTAAISANKVYIYDQDETNAKIYDAYAALSVSKRSDGSYLAIFGDRAELLSN